MDNSQFNFYVFLCGMGSLAYVVLYYLIKFIKFLRNNS